MADTFCTFTRNITSHDLLPFVTEGQYSHRSFNAICTYFNTCIITKCNVNNYSYLSHLVFFYMHRMYQFNLYIFSVTMIVRILYFEEKKGNTCIINQSINQSILSLSFFPCLCNFSHLTTIQLQHYCQQELKKHTVEKKNTFLEYNLSYFKDIPFQNFKLNFAIKHKPYK